MVFECDVLYDDEFVKLVLILFIEELFVENIVV